MLLTETRNQVDDPREACHSKKKLIGKTSTYVTTLGFTSPPPALHFPKSTMLSIPYPPASYLLLLNGRGHHQVPYLTKIDTGKKENWGSQTLGIEQELPGVPTASKPGRDMENGERRSQLWKYPKFLAIGSGLDKYREANAGFCTITLSTTSPRFIFPIDYSFFPSEKKYSPYIIQY